MDLSIELLSVYIIPLLSVWFIYIRRKSLSSKVFLALQKEEFEAGLTEPASLHPVFDHNRCLGCGSCVSACPEQDHHPVLGLVDGKATLVAPANCIGHGACKTACPMNAVSLVFGTARRGVDIPVLKPNYESTIPGIFVAGELGGMGLIRNAIEQGKKAMDAIVSLSDLNNSNGLDVLIVGAGPAGLSASLRAKEKKLNYVTVEQEALGGTVYQYPRGKIVMTSPVDLPLAGKMKFRETSKEKLLEFWER
jgi:heterodisulfide reductase subunit A-like polyferredoxin